MLVVRFLSDLSQEPSDRPRSRYTLQISHTRDITCLLPIETSFESGDEFLLNGHVIRFCAQVQRI